MENYKHYDFLSPSSKVSPDFVQKQRPWTKGTVHNGKTNKLLDRDTGGLHAVFIYTEVPMCSRALSLCIHAIYPVFSSTKVEFSFCLVPSNCSLFREVRVSF